SCGNRQSASSRRPAFSPAGREIRRGVHPAYRRSFITDASHTCVKTEYDVPEGHFQIRARSLTRLKYAEFRDAVEVVETDSLASSRRPAFSPAGRGIRRGVRM